MRFALRIFLVICFVVQGPVTAANAPERPKSTHDQQYEFLFELMNRVETILRMNRDMLDILATCYEDNLDNPDCNEKRETHAINIQTRHELFKKDVLTISLVHRAEMLMRLFRKQAQDKSQTYAWDRDHLFLDVLVNPINEIDTIATLSETGERLRDTPTEELNNRQKANRARSRLRERTQGLFYRRSYKYTENEYQFYLRPPERPELKDMMYENTDEGERVRLDYPYTVGGYLEYMCDSYHEVLKRRIPESYQYVAWDKRPICKKLHLDYSEEFGGFYFPHAEYLNPSDHAFMEGLGSYMVLGAQAVQAQNIKERYLAEMSKAPYVALVSSPEPSNAELARIFRFMNRNATVELEEVRADIAEVNEQWIKFDRDIERWSENENRVRTWETLQNDPEAYAGIVTGYSEAAVPLRTQMYRYAKPPERKMNKALAFMNFTHVAEKVAQPPYTYKMNLLRGTNYQDVYVDLMESFASSQLRKLGVDIAMAIGVTMACYLPWTKLPMLARAAAVAKAGRGLSIRNLFCIPGTTLAVNYYFYSEADHIYDYTYRRVFSTIEGQTLLADLKQLNDAEFGLVMEMIFFPLGVVSIRGAWHVIKKLKPENQKYLEQVVDELADEARRAG